MKSSTGTLFSGVLALVLAIGPGADSTLTQVPGYGGVLPLPAPVEEITLAPSLNELLGTRRTGSQASTGRVLYANDHTSRPAESERTARSRRPGSELVQSRSSAAPNS